MGCCIQMNLIILNVSGTCDCFPKNCDLSHDQARSVGDDEISHSCNLLEGTSTDLFWPKFRLLVDNCRVTLKVS
jgi:hypothetical protein